jgi:hypothetical protein
MKKPLARASGGPKRSGSLVPDNPSVPHPTAGGNPLRASHEDNFCGTRYDRTISGS